MAIAPARLKRVATDHLPADELKARWRFAIARDGTEKGAVFFLLLVLVLVLVLVIESAF